MYALVDCNNYYASCECVFDSKLRGRPVVVLSNNDGCVISRSPEAKAIGVAMGAPIFKLDSLVRRENVAVLSANFALYGDMSDRIVDVLRGFAERLEVYSIDESFLYRDGETDCWPDYGWRIKRQVERWTGIPVSVGFGVTKTLAKLANSIAKREGGVFYLEPGDEHRMKASGVLSVWGIGRSNAEKLEAAGIWTAYDLQQAESAFVRKLLTVTGQRTHLELRGTPCIELEEVRPQRREICCSRSFGRMLSGRDEVGGAVSAFVARAAEKMRSERLVCGCIRVFVETNGHRKDLEQYASSATVPLPVATSHTPTLLRFARGGLDAIFRDGYWYKRAGVLLLDTSPQEAVQQGLFISGENDPKYNEVMRVMDALNRKFGKRTVVPCSLGFEEPHRMNQQRLSPRYTTRWKDLMIVRL